MEAGNLFEAYGEECIGLHDPNKEDEELIQHLREKYRKERESGTPAAPAAGPMDGISKQKNHDAVGTSQASSMKIRFSICQSCQGSGRKTETYNFRVLESDCPSCHGECIIDTNPKDSREGKENVKVGESQQQCICLRCRKTGSEDSMFCCSRCKTTVYCGKDCQTKDWSNHRLACRRVAT